MFPKKTTLPASFPALPVSEHLPELRNLLDTHPTALLSAPPGSGKTTLIPPALLQARWRGDRKVIVLEPRRLAARAAARRVAGMLGEEIGETVGYQVRMERRLGPSSRIEFLTEGLLTRRILSDPELENTAIVIFDEFHERGLQADLALALCRDIQRELRPDLRLLIMSATLDPRALKPSFPEAPFLEIHAPTHPVETVLLDRPDPRPAWKIAAETAARARNTQAGDLLVFLPGEAEIRRAEAALRGTLPPGTVLRPLYGALPRADQDAAIAPSPPGQRKIVLASAIAESSLTIEGVTVVIDAGWMRFHEYSPHWGMNRLVTRRIPRDRADQRRGRAGRTGPGRCLRLWDASVDQTLPPSAPPEILRSDLAGAALQLADWGVSDPAKIPWITPPPAQAWREARALLHALDALDPEGRITPHGRRMVALGAHPRLAHMMVSAAEQGGGETACRLAALISEMAESGFSHREIDIEVVSAHVFGPARAPDPAAQRIRRLAAGWQRRLGISRSARGEGSAGARLADAFPDRLCRKIDAPGGRFRLRNGRTAFLDPDDPLRSADWLIAPEIQETNRGIRIRRAASLRDDEVEAAFGRQIREADRVLWDPESASARAVRERRLDGIRISTRVLKTPPPEQLLEVLLAEIRRRGLGALPGARRAEPLRRRARFAASLLTDPDWPRLDEATLENTLEQWLGPFLAGVHRWDRIDEATVETALRSRFTRRQLLQIERLAPVQLQTPGGRRIRLHYQADGPPILAVRIQDAFGWAETPTVGGGTVPVRLHLLSPAMRPVQITDDLAGFWREGYRRARKELRGRYPKHAWPEIPPAARNSSDPLR